MNKKLLTMAVGTALAFGAATAQAEVTVYGQLQAEVAKVDVDVDEIDENVGNIYVDDNESDDQSGWTSDDNKRGRLGIKASEDLGGGMTGLAKFEWQVDTTDGNPNDGARETYVGLKGGFGTVLLGNIQSAYKVTGGTSYDTFVTTFLEARSWGGGMLGNGIGTADLPYEDAGGTNANNLKAWTTHGFVRDSLAYKNKWGMVSLYVNYGLEGVKSESAEHATNFGDLSASVTVAQGNWEVFGALVSKDVTYNPAAGLQNRGTYAANKFGGKFKFGGGGMSHTIKAQLEAFVLEEDEQIDTVTTSATFGNANATVLDDELEGAANFVGYDLGMGKTTFTVQVGATVVEGDDNAAGFTDEDQETTASYTAVGVTHKFSKKTRVFAGLRTTNIEVDYDDPATYDEEVDVSVFSLGLRKDF